MSTSLTRDSIESTVSHISAVHMDQRVDYKHDVLHMKHQDMDNDSDKYEHHHRDHHMLERYPTDRDKDHAEVISLASPSSLSLANPLDNEYGEPSDQYKLVEEELQSTRESESKYKQQLIEAQRREKMLIRRLAAKEQEMQEYINQNAELKAAQAPTVASLRSVLLDPAVNILFQKLKAELHSTKAKLEDTQNELSAWKFTPDSNTGKRLMAKCRLLYQENEELGKMTSNGRLAKLEGDLALQKSFSEEVKKSQSELDDFLQELDEDVEGMQSTILFLQQELKLAKDGISNLERENAALKSGVSETNCICSNNGHGVKLEAEKASTNEPASPDHHFNGMKTDATDAPEQRSLRSARGQNTSSDEHRLNSLIKPNQQLPKSGNGNNPDANEQNGVRYNALSDDEEYDEDEVLSTSSDEHHHDSQVQSIYSSHKTKSISTSRKRCTTIKPPTEHSSLKKKRLLEATEAADLQ